MYIYTILLLLLLQYWLTWRESCVCVCARAPTPIFHKSCAAPISRRARAVSPALAAGPHGRTAARAAARVALELYILTGSFLFFFLCCCCCWRAPVSKSPDSLRECVAAAECAPYTVPVIFFFFLIWCRGGRYTSRVCRILGAGMSRWCGARLGYRIRRCVERLCDLRIAGSEDMWSQWWF